VQRHLAAIERVWGNIDGDTLDFRKRPPRAAPAPSAPAAAARGGGDGDDSDDDGGGDVVWTGGDSELELGDDDID
jgi:hypothetical protein